MNHSDTLVVLDTCVQLRLRLSDVLMDMRAERLFSAHWTESIDDEFLRNMVKVYGLDRAKAAGRLRVKDFARAQMKRLGVRVLRPGQFLDEAFDAHPEAMSRAVSQAAKELKKPPYTLAELLHVLRQAGARRLVAGMSKTRST
ncbi:hypothetical protein [Roseateles sp.]|uniref:hypothetical protein n=1 Tax=Roseateles sp. TaxID=1971397 RepID=UPI002F4097A5